MFVTSAVISLVVSGTVLFYSTILKDLPSASALLTYEPDFTTKIYDRNHVLLYKVYRDENRSWVPLSQISPSMIEATIAIEDKDFYSHHGLSLRGILRSLKLALIDHRVQGGSTITQQLLKNTLLSPERTLTRKIKEMILALQVESVMTKQQILEMYLNEVPYGGNTYGVEEASQKYFHKTASELDLAESAYLAGLPASPSVYSQEVPTPDTTLARTREVLRRLKEDGKISPLQEIMALSEKITIVPSKEEIKAPHFVMYVRQLLNDRFGDSEVAAGGLEVITSLDLGIQNQTQEIVTNEVKQLTSRHVTNGAALVTNPATGEILAMIGSKDYFNTRDDGQVNVTLRLRQPGSSIKPLMYSAALEHGFTPATILDDSPVVFPNRWGAAYAPKNYDGQWHGKETLRVALASSHNVPAVKTENTIGLQTFIDRARTLGITTWADTSRFGLSLTLGGGEVKMVDMAVAYGTFANGGNRIDLNPILSVRDHKGQLLYENECALNNVCDGQAVLDPRIAFQITSILSDNVARSRAFGFNSVLNIPSSQVAVKTGTTNSLRDNWTIGYTPTRLVATWVGNNDNSPMSAVVSGITGASPIWNKIMRTQINSNQPFIPPSNMVSLMICATTGQPLCGDCPHAYREYFLPGTSPAANCPSPNSLAGSPSATPPQQATAVLPFTPTN